MQQFFHTGIQPRFDFTDRLLGLNHHVLCFDRVDDRQQIAFLNKITLFDVQGLQLPVDLGTDIHFLQCIQLAGGHHFLFECAALHIRCHIADRRIFAVKEPKTAGDQNNQNAGGHYFFL